MFKPSRFFQSFALATALCVLNPFPAGAGEQFTVAGITFTKPDNWKKVAPASSMRAAQLEVREGSAKADVVFFYFGPGGAGGVDANVDRWLRQFQEPKDKLNARVEARTIKGTKVTFVEASGTFMDGRPFGPKTPKPDYGLLGIIIEGPQGAIFIKETGPRKLVESSKNAARKMVEDALK